jgi:DNA-binding NarL/FixJ family response regulator
MAVHPVQVVVAEDEMPAMSGTELLAAAKAHYPDVIGMLLAKSFDGEQLRSDIKQAFAACHASS